jgi:uncharacterized protein with FMN-binding domain
MIGNKAQRLISRTVVTAAIVAATVVLILIYVRSGGNGTGAGAVTLRPNASRSGASSERSGRSAAGESPSSGGPPTSSGRQTEEARKGSEASGGNGGAGAAGGNAGAPPKSGAGGATGTYTGPVVETEYGPVQVAVTEQGGRIVDAKALQLPTDRPRSLSISEQAAPLLREEALQAQSAQINIVSGATFTSEGYAESLQKALSRVP